jgi:anti-anti-sigma factor
VDYINSTGIALIVGLLARARKSHRRLLACGLSEHYIEIFQITRLADFMTVFPDEKSAVDVVPALVAGAQ